MRQSRFQSYFRWISCFLFILLLAPAGWAEEAPIKAGTQVPSFNLPAPDSAQAASYLGLKGMDPGPFSNIVAKIVVVEFMSAKCPHCFTNAPIVNRLYKVIQEDKALGKDVKVIAIAIGNNKTEMDAFKKNFKVPFPMFPDEQLNIAGTFEIMETPTIVVMSNKGKVLTSHGGVIKDFDGFLKELRSIHKNQ